MDMIGIDLHKRESQLCTLARRRHGRRAAHRHEPRAVHRRVRDPGAGAHSARGEHRERVGRAASRGARPRGHRRRPELRADVRDALAAGEDGQARCAHAGRGASARRLSPGASGVGGAPARARGARRARRARAHAHAVHRDRQGVGAARGPARRRAANRISSRKRVAALELSATLEAELAPLFALLAPFNAQITAADRRIAALEQADPIVALLATAPSVGPLTASAVVATLDDVTRFRVGASVRGVPRARARRAQLGRETAQSGRSRRRATRERGICSSKPGWRILRSKIAGDRGAARVGARRSRRAAATGSPSSRWRVGWRGFSTRCGATTRRTTRHEASHAAAADRASELTLSAATVSDRDD